jgi:hypothetical protein
MIVFCCTGAHGVTTVADRSSLVESVVVSCCVGYRGADVEKVCSSVLELLALRSCTRGSDPGSAVTVTDRCSVVRVSSSANVISLIITMAIIRVAIRFIGASPSETYGECFHESRLSSRPGILPLPHGPL